MRFYRFFHFIRLCTIVLFFGACCATLFLAFRVFPLLPFPYMPPSERINSFRILTPVSLISAACVILCGRFASPSIIKERTSVLCALFGLMPAVAYLALRFGVNSTLVCFHFFMPSLILTGLVIFSFISDLVGRIPKRHLKCAIVFSIAGVLCCAFLIFNLFCMNIPYKTFFVTVLVLTAAEFIATGVGLFSFRKVCRFSTVGILVLHILFFQLFFYADLMLLIYLYLILLLLLQLVRLAFCLTYLKKIKW